MRFMSTRMHGAADYVVGILLIVSPYLFGFANGGAAQWLPMLLGAGVIIYSLMTRYELGIIPVIPMPAHLCLDAAGGLLLLVSPWLFGFADQVYLPHVIIGLVEIGAAVTTRTGMDPTTTKPAGVGERTGNAVAAGMGAVLIAAALAVGYMAQDAGEQTAGDEPAGAPTTSQ